MEMVNLLCEFGVMGMFFYYIVGLVCERAFEFG
jgi:hypothetical protein